MFLRHYIYTEPNLGNAEKSIDVLVNEFGLVPAFHPTDDREYVWEDEQGIGRYNVRFKNNRRYDKKEVDIIMFHYWANESRANRTIFERDPMKDAVLRVKQVLKGILFEDRFEDYSLDEAMEVSTNPGYLKGKYRGKLKPNCR